MLENISKDVFLDTIPCACFNRSPNCSFELLKAISCARSSKADVPRKETYFNVNTYKYPQSQIQSICTQLKSRMCPVTLPCPLAPWYHSKPSHTEIATTQISPAFNTGAMCRHQPELKQTNSNTGSAKTPITLGSAILKFFNVFHNRSLCNFLCVQLCGQGSEVFDINKPILLLILTDMTAFFLFI